MKRSTCAFVLACATVVGTLTVRGEDWPQWRGPNRDGVSMEKGLMQQWPEGGPKLVWQVKDLGMGYSTPAVVGDRLYVLGNEGLENEYVRALDVKDGKTVWTTKIGKVGNPTQRPAYPAARSTPTVDGDVMYVLGSDGDLACLDRASGSINWTKNLRKEFGGKPGEWAYAESPLVDGDWVVVTPGAQTAMAALNKKSGETVWKTPGNGEEAAYSSIVVAEVGGVKQYVQFLAKALVGVDAKTGKLLWRYEQTAKGSPANMSTAVVHDGYVYSQTTRGGGGLVKLKVDGGNVIAEQVYASQKLPTAIGGAVKVGEHLYGTGTVLMCVEFTTGTVKWTGRGVGAGSVVAADGRLYVHGENGDVLLVEATPEEYREKGRFSPPDQPDRGNSKAWAYPVVANGKLYIRDAGALWCYDVAK